MIVKFGDTVIVPMRDKLSDSEVARLKAKLVEVWSGVRWEIIAESTMTHALVLEGGGSASPDVLAMAKRYERKLGVALDMLDLVVSKFQANDHRDEWASEMARQIEVGRWQQWIADARRMS